MTSTTTTDEMLRMDRRGRVRVPPERRRALLEEFARSGLSGAAFARMAGIKYATFANWRQQQRRRAADVGQRAGEPAVLGGGSMRSGRVGCVQLLEAIVEGEERPEGEGSRTGGLLIELPGGSRVRVASPSQLAMAAELLALLARARC